MTVNVVTAERQIVVVVLPEVISCCRITITNRFDGNLPVTEQRFGLNAKRHYCDK